MRLLSTICALLLPAAVAHAAELALRHDPFRRPDLSRLVGVVRAESPADAPQPRLPRLRGVVVAGSASVASIDGVTVPLGGEVDGFRVERIGEDGVRLRRGHEIVELKLDPVQEARR